MNLTTTQQAVMIALFENDAGKDGERLLTYKSLEQETGKNHRCLKTAITKCRAQGLVVHSPAVSYEDWTPCGSGFKLTDKGDEVTRIFEKIKKGIEAGEY